MLTPGVLRSLGYELVDFLGKGSYGEVRLANSKRHKKQVAIKIMNRRLKPRVFVHKLLPRELLILKTVRHPHIIQVHEIFEMPNGQVFVVMEAAAMDLQQKIWDLGHVPIGDAKIWFSQLLSAVEYLHQQDIVHRDLKCKNVLLTADNQIKLADFGLGRFSKGFPDLCNTFYCTPGSAPPEVLAKKPYDAKKSDVWSLGIIFYSMVTGTMPFFAFTPEDLVVAQKEPLTFPNGISVDMNCKNFVKFILQNDPSTRPSVTEVANHPWMKSDQECEKEESETSGENLEEDSGEDDPLCFKLGTSSRPLSSGEISYGQVIIHGLEDNSGDDDDDDDEDEDDDEIQDGGTSSSDTSSSEICGLQKMEDVSLSSSSSNDDEEIISGPQEDGNQVRASNKTEVVEVVEEEEHGCLSFIPICAAVKRVAAPILRASRTFQERMRSFFKAKSMENNSCSASKASRTSSDVVDQSGLVMEPTEEKTKRLRFPKFKMPKKTKTVPPL